VPVGGNEAGGSNTSGALLESGIGS
jgi:hypothetical protein